MTRVYTSRGQLAMPESRFVRFDGSPPERLPTIADRVAVTAIMTRDVVCARSDLPVDALTRLMVDHHIGCIPIVDDRGRPHGIVTKLDLVETKDRDPKRTARDVMMPLAITLDERATVAHAASMMTLEDLHHVMIVSADGTLAGVMSSKDVVRWLVDNDELGGGMSDTSPRSDPWRPQDDEE